MPDWEELSKCPCCGATDPRLILYGMPDDVALRAAEQGILALGVCVVWGEMTIVSCRECDHKWGRLPEDSLGPPDLIADGRSVFFEDLRKLLEGAGWNAETRQNRTDGNQAKAKLLFTKPELEVQVEMWLSLDSDDVPLWTHGSLDDTSEADRVYALLASAGLTNPTRTRPWWTLPST